MQEIATLPENRFLKFGLDADEKEIEARFEKSWARVRARAKKLNMTEEDIETEIRAVREGK